MEGKWKVVERNMIVKNKELNTNITAVSQPLSHHSRDTTKHDTKGSVVKIQI